MGATARSTINSICQESNGFSTKGAWSEYVRRASCEGYMMERMDTARPERATARSPTAQAMSANLSDAMLTAIVTGIARAYSLGVQDGDYHVLGHEKAPRSHRSLIRYPASFTNKTIISILCTVRRGC